MLQAFCLTVKREVGLTFNRVGAFVLKPKFDYDC